ncbi:D-alanyl-D-alanine dipeptidase [Corynebacterium endometrii]|uniref:D-alanyl-D-alanine dipeptidase n=2 Tax=Corynebacterium endometrii TaxID=2488819 RepID=A0A4P7QF38_9CORY|nr:D-alanyl-D-alanine dipeptidase [Corynebacterium endometrii]
MRVPSPWLQPLDYDAVRPLVPTDLPALPKPPDDGLLARKPVAECGDSLLCLPDDLQRRHAYLELRSPRMPKQMYSRGQVIERLRAAEETLPEPFHLLILDTWRTVDAQRELTRIYSNYTSDLCASYVADADNPQVPAPHTTGAAVDLTLSIDGKGLPMGADFDEFGPAAHFLQLEDLAADADPSLVLARDLRRLLAHTMLAQGFAPIFSEWWHFSYGDQRWAVFYDEPHARYDIVNVDN